MTDHERLVKAADVYLDEMFPERIAERAAEDRMLAYAILASETVEACELLLLGEPVPTALIRPEYR